MEMYATYGAALTASPEALAVMQKYFPEVFSVWNNDLRGTGKDPAADRKLLIEKHTEKIVCPAVEEKSHHIPAQLSTQKGNLRCKPCFLRY